MFALIYIKKLHIPKQVTRYDSISYHLQLSTIMSHMLV